MKPTILVYLTPVVLSLAACQTTTTALSPSTTVEKSCDGTNAMPCRVSVVTLNWYMRTGTVDINRLMLATGKPNLHVFWILKDGCFFNAASGDGVFLKKPSDNADRQFEDQKPTDDESPNPTPNPDNGKKYHWKAKNDSHHGKAYEYKMIFHCDDGDPFVIDPWIQNG